MDGQDQTQIRRRGARKLLAAAAVALGGIGVATPAVAHAAPVAPAQTCSTIDFETATVEKLADTGDPATTTYLLTVKGWAPYFNMTVSLNQLVYIQQPDYWGFEVQGCLPGEIGLPALKEYTVAHKFTGTVGKCGIEVIGSTVPSQKFDLAGCSDAAPSPLAGTRWVLDASSLGLPAPTRPITANFSKTTVNGHGSCNTYSGSYVTSGAKFDAFNIVSTKIACQPPNGPAENEYFHRLDAATRYSFGRGLGIRRELLLLNDDGKVLLRFFGARPYVS